MKSEIILVIFGLFLFGIISNQAVGQLDSIADHVVINEVETNPPGSDADAISEWVELFNPTNEEISIGGWEIASTTVLKKTLVIPDGTQIKSQQFASFQYQSVWFTDVSERIELRDSTGIVIDETPTITDLDNDFTSWQRLYDGYDTDSLADWTFETSNAGSTNGKIITEESEDAVIVSVSTDKSNYIFDETLTISGTVSKEIFVEKPFFHQETIDIIVQGPNYYKTFTLYPNMFLEYQTSLNLQKVLGINQGTYDVSVSYATNQASTQFSVGTEFIEIDQKGDASLIITTDKDSYLPGETAIIFVETSEILDFEGLKFEVLDPNNVKIYQGTLFPNISAISSVFLDNQANPYPDAQFATTIYMDTVSPIYGTHTIVAQYGTQTAISTFVVFEDIKEDTLISLSTDKPVYGLGETVIISGRLNNLFITSMDLEILQTGIVSFSTDTDSILKELDVVRLEGDSTFTHLFKIPNNSDRLGEYRVKVSKDLGEAIIFFRVVENPDEYVATTFEGISLFTNKLIYETGDNMVIYGEIDELVSSSVYLTAVVDISITREDGSKIIIDTFKPVSNEAVSATFFLTALPDIVGNYSVEQVLYHNVFDEGTYNIKASYANGKFSETVSFSVIDPLNIDVPFLLQLNKDVFGFGETVYLDGLVPNIAQGSGVTITLIKPDTDTEFFGALPDNSKFSWSWETPIAEKKYAVTNERVVTYSNYGIYQIILGLPSGDTSLFFKVSPNPEEDSLEIAPLLVTTDKAIYEAGETLTVLGTAIKRQQGSEGLVVQDRAEIIVSYGDFPFKEIYNAFVYLDNGGNFKSSFSLPVSIFTDGSYKVVSVYQERRAETLFAVDNDFNIGGDAPLILLLNLDKDEYALGETVQISGRPSKLVYLENLSITIIHEDDLQITCGVFVCGRPVAPTPLVTSPSGSFTHEYTISNSSDDIGKYQVFVDTEFGEYTSSFTVTSEPAILQVDEEQFLGKRTTEKFNRIPDSFVPISVSGKTSDGVKLLPRVLQGSLLAPTRDDEANVNIKITTQDGICIIGQAAGCLVTSLTRGPGTIYQVVEIDDINYKIRYSGHDVRLEKFTILPESSSEPFPDSTWNVEVIKDEQPSRLYYKITYIISE